MYYLMIKTHNITGLKYLCQTKRKDPIKYLGSGVKWRSHLNKHGKDISTEILGSYENKEDLISAGIYYSKLWDVVNSNSWANLKLEEGDGGDTSHTSGWKTGMKNRRSYSGTSNPNYGKSGSWKNKVGPVKGMSWFNNGSKETFSLNLPEGFSPGRLLFTCKFCGKNCNEVNLKRWHNDYCKQNPDKKDKISHLTGKLWWNNGKEQKKFKDAPDDSWTRGRIDMTGANNPMRKQK